MNGFRSNFLPWLLPPADQLVDQILRRRCVNSAHVLESFYDPVSRVAGSVRGVRGNSTRAHAGLLAVQASQVAPRDGFGEDPLEGDADSWKSELFRRHSSSAAKNK